MTRTRLFLLTRVLAAAVVLLGPAAGRATGDVGYSGNVAKTIVDVASVDLQFGDGALARVELPGPGIVRVRFAPRGRFTDETSGAVASGGAAPVPATIADVGDVVYVLTERLTVAILKSPYQVVVLGADGALISADLTPAVSWDTNTGAIYTRKYASPDEHYFGLGERGGAIDRRGRAVFMKNVDFGGYGELTDPLYMSLPFYYAVRQGRASGLFLDNPATPFFDFDSGQRGEVIFGALDGDLDYYVFAGPAPLDVAAAYARLTGHMPLPPKWTLGYQQSRFGYRTQDEFLSLASAFRAQQIPCDVLYFDLHYMDNLQQLSWDPVNFPDPSGLNAELERRGFRRVNIVEPFVLTHDRTWPFLAASNFFVTRPDGTPFLSEIFLGRGSWIDFTRTTARDWYREVLKWFLTTGVSAVWNDLNEPADNFMPDAVYDYDGAPRPDARARNVYALQQTSLTYQALRELRPNVRPWVLSRSGYAGIQRYAANWSGDTLSTFDSLRVSVQMSISMGLSGQNQFGHDVGGFLGSPSPELFLRWLEFGSMTPLFRTHSVDTAAAREPWSYGEPYTSLSREIINRRYRWLPFFYSLMERASRTGEPVLAPTFFHFPGDPATYRQDDAYMLGSTVLVAPVVVDGARTRAVYLPAGTNWVDYHTDAVYPGGRTVTVPAPLGRVPMFVREGSVVPGGPALQHVDEAVAQRVTVEVYAGPDSTFSLYEDDGISLDYANGTSLRRGLSSATRTNTVEFTAHAAQGTWVPPARSWWVTFHNVPAPPLAVTHNGSSLSPVESEAALEAASAAWHYQAGNNRLIVHVPDSPDRFTVVVRR